MIWNNVHIPSSPEIQAFERLLNAKQPFHPLLVNLLFQRGITTMVAVKAFFVPSEAQLHSPWLFKDMEKAVERILKAIREDEKILLYGDYDVDGTTSVSLMKLFFEDWGLDIPYYIPDRFKEGYGISIEGIDYAHSHSVTLMIALDCGAKAVDKVRYAKQLGIDVIVVDHHTVGEEAPPCHAMVNPRQSGCEYPFAELPACGLALKLATALSERMPTLEGKVCLPENSDVFDRFRDLTSLAIASDIVPLIGENRVIASKGLEKIKKGPLPGIDAMKRLSEQPREWNIEDLVFFIGPRINSAGRLYSARASVDLLIGKNQEINQFAADLHDYNKERKMVEDDIFQEAMAKVEEERKTQERAATVLWDKNWNKGVIGIVASKLIERVYRPTIMLTESNGKWVGSGRSVEGFDLYAALDACSEHLLQFGGHKYAAGLTLDGASLDAFKEAFEAHVAANLGEDQKAPLLEISGEIRLDELDERLVRQIRLFSPFGPGNMEPVWMAKDVEVRDLRILKEAHVRMMLAQGDAVLEAIGFGLAWRWAEVDSTRIDIAFQVDFKHYRDKTYIQLKLKDIRPAHS